MPELNYITALYAQARLDRRCVIPPNAKARRTLSRRVLQGAAVRPHPGLYAERTYWQTLNPNEQALHVIRALAVLHPGWVFAGPSAALVHGLDCSYALARPLYRAVRRSERTAPCKGLLCIGIADDEPITTVNGITVTSATATVYDCAALFAPSYSLPFADAALRTGTTDMASLQSHVAAQRHDRHWEKASQVIALADGMSENGGESRCRGVLYECGADKPRLQVTVKCLTDPRRVHRVDMLWDRHDGTRVACEFDGTRKYVDPAMVGTRSVQEIVAEERDRQQCLERQGIEVFRLFYDQLDELGTIRRMLYEHRVPMNDIIRRNLGVWVA